MSVAWQHHKDTHNTHTKQFSTHQRAKITVAIGLVLVTKEKREKKKGEQQQQQKKEENKKEKRPDFDEFERVVRKQLVRVLRLEPINHSSCHDKSQVVVFLFFFLFFLEWL